jgi:hypothetical protein
MNKILRANDAGFRDELLFDMRINSTLRISDLLKLTVGDIIDDNNDLKSEIVIKEQKINKVNSIKSSLI